MITMVTMIKIQTILIFLFCFGTGVFFIKDSVFFYKVFTVSANEQRNDNDNNINRNSVIFAVIMAAISFLTAYLYFGLIFL